MPAGSTFLMSGLGHIALSAPGASLRRMPGELHGLRFPLFAAGSGGGMMSETHNVINCERGAPIHAWTRGVVIEPEAEKQLRNVAQLPFIFRWIAVMPD